MANDRIYLVCKTCKERRMLWKFYPIGGKLDGGYLAEEELLHEFMYKHLKECHPHAHGMMLKGDPGFLLETEQWGNKHSITALVGRLVRENQE